MKLLIQGLCVSALISVTSCVSASISVSSAELNIFETQNAIMQEIPARLREQTLEDKQIINGCTVTRKLITRQWAESMLYERLKNRMSEGKSYIMIIITAGERKKRTLGGGNLILLYDTDTYELIDRYRTR